MHTLLQKSSVLFIVILSLSVLPLQAQKVIPHKPFIQKGTILTGFSVGVINASHSAYNPEFGREVTDISIQFDGLYFVNDRVGVGPLLGYKFTYRDLVGPFRNGDEVKTRKNQFEFGAKAGWYLPLSALTGGDGGTRFFVDGGLSLMQNRIKKEGTRNVDAPYQFGYQLGTGFLFPIGKQIALETKLGFRARRHQYHIGFQNSEGEIITSINTRWLKQAALQIGLKVSF